MTTDNNQAYRLWGQHNIRQPQDCVVIVRRMGERHKNRTLERGGGGGRGRGGSHAISNCHIPTLLYTKRKDGNRTNSICTTLTRSNHMTPPHGVSRGCGDGGGHVVGTHRRKHKATHRRANMEVDPSQTIRMEIIKSQKGLR